MREKSRRAREDRRTQRQMRSVFILFAFGIIVFSQALSMVLEYLLIRFGFAEDNNFTFFESALLVGGVSVIIGTLLSWFAGRYVLRPFDELLKGMSALSDGKYEIRLRERRGHGVREVGGLPEGVHLPGGERGDESVARELRPGHGVRPP